MRLLHLARLASVAALALCLSLPLPGFAAPVEEGEVIRVHEVPQERLGELARMGDFWGINWREDYVNLYVSPAERDAIEALGFRVETDGEKMRELREFQAVDRQAWRDAGRDGIPGFECYRTVDETYTDLEALATDHPDLARWEIIGETWLAQDGDPGGDDIHALVIGNDNVAHSKAPLMIMAAQHARELVTAESATRFAEWLIDNYDENPTARWLVDHREIHIIAQQNPDGRREVEDGDAWWRKNSNLDACPGSNPGIDLNRNSDYFWGDHSDGNACSDTYRGVAPASEPETSAMQDYIDQVFDDYRSDPDVPVPADAEGLFFSLHSYSELILFPWEGLGTGSSNDAPNHNQLAYLGRKLGYFTGYAVGRAILYPAGGTMVDYAHAERGVAAFTYEIGTTFQQSCSSFESGIWPDIFESLVYAAKATERPYQAPFGPDVLDPQAAYDPLQDSISVSGLADDTRYSRGGSSEHPASDPVFDIATVTASLDVPPHLASETFNLTLEENGNVAGFAGEFTPPNWSGEPRLLFLQAENSAGHNGVPEAVWIETRSASLSPDAFAFELVAGFAQDETLEIANIGSGILTFEVEVEEASSDPACDGTGTPAPWLSAMPVSGSVAEGEAEAVTITVDAETLAEGTYEAHLCVETNDPTLPLAVIPVDLDVIEDPPVIAVDPEHLVAEVDEGDSGNATMDIGNTGASPLDWSVDEAPSGCALPDWVGVSPGAGTVAPGESELLSLDLDATDIAPGDYQVTLCLASNDPANTHLEVEVDVTVIPTTTLIEGTVDGLGHCQDDPSALDGALIQVVGQFDAYTTTTDVSGGYSLVVPADEAPVTISASKAGHRSDSESDVGLVAGETVVADFGLVLRAACAAVSPPALSFTLAPDEQDAAVWTLSNADGGDDLSWSLETGAGCHDSAGESWLELSHTGGIVAWGAERTITVGVDGAGLEAGVYTTTLCLTTSDAESGELEVPVELELRDAEIYHDRFEKP